MCCECQLSNLEEKKVEIYLSIRLNMKMLLSCYYA